MQSDLFRTQALDQLRSKPWQPPLLSRPTSGLGLSLMVSVSATLLIGFAALFPFAQKERVTGYLEPSQGWTTLIAPRFAVVRRCTVSEGDMVSSGDIVCELTSSEGLAAGQLLESKLLLDLEERRKALNARRDATRLKYEQEVQLLEQGRSADVEDREFLFDEAKALSARLEIAARQRDQGLKLLQSGALSEIDLTELEDRFQARSAELARARREVEQVESRLRSHDVRVRRMDSTRKEALAAVDEQFQAIDMEEARLQASEEQLVLAPRDGRVASIRVQVGASVSPGDPLMDILPIEQSLQARLYADPAVMSTIAVGQVVRVYIDSLPYERHGAQEGVVRAISKTTFASERTGPVPAYRVVVAFPDGFDLSPEQIRTLRPGMTVTADLIRGHATMLDWLIDPLRKGAERV